MGNLGGPFQNLGVLFFGVHFKPNNEQFGSWWIMYFLIELINFPCLNLWKQCLLDQKNSWLQRGFSRNIWFLGFKPHQAYLQQRETWMWSFLAKILEGEHRWMGRAGGHLTLETWKVHKKSSQKGLWRIARGVFLGEPSEFFGRDIFLTSDLMDLDANEMMRWTTLSNHDESLFFFFPRGIS